MVNVIHVFKKGSNNSRDNYRPISILKNVYEKIIFKQVGQFMDIYFSKFQCDFRKDYSTQQCLVVLTELRKLAVDKWKTFPALLTDLSKAFDCLSHEVLLAELHAYGFSVSTLRLVQSYLSDRKQRAKINESYSLLE